MQSVVFSKTFARDHTQVNKRTSVKLVGLFPHLSELERKEAVVLRADRHAGEIGQGDAGLHLARLLVGQQHVLLRQQQNATRALQATRNTPLRLHSNRIWQCEGGREWEIVGQHVGMHQSIYKKASGGNFPRHKKIHRGEIFLTLPLALLILLTTSASRTFSSTQLLSL